MITVSYELPITTSEVLYGLGIVLVVLGAIIVIKGFKDRKKFKEDKI